MAQMTSKSGNIWRILSDKQSPEKPTYQVTDGESLCQPVVHVSLRMKSLFHARHIGIAQVGQVKVFSKEGQANL